MNRPMLTGLIILILLLTLSQAHILAQESNLPIISISNADGKPGDFVTVTVSLTGAKAISGGEIEISYDPNIVKPIKIPRGPLLGGALFVTNLEFSSNSLKLVWASIEQASENQGTICTIDFQVKNTGITPIEVKTMTLKDLTLANVAQSAKIGGSIKIGSQESVTGPNPEQQPTVPVNLPPIPGSLPDMPITPPGEQPINVPGNMPLVGFPDMPTTHWAYNDIILMTQKGILSGYPDGTFQPNNAITRAEFAKIMLLAIGVEPYAPPAPYFSDVDKQNWAFPYVETARIFISGYIETTTQNRVFRPSEAILREDVAAAVVKALGLVDESIDLRVLDKFPDKAQISPGMEKLVAAAVANGLMIGTDKGFEPKKTLTRAEACTLLLRVLTP